MISDPTVLTPTALTIAGSDSGGGAGIQADLKTFQARGVYGASVLTALTAQNTVGVQGVLPIAPEFIRRQLDSVFEDIGFDAVKTGMLVDAATIHAVADGLEAHGVTNLVVDPVMIAKSGDLLLADDARDAMRERMIPLARVVTPNLHEASALLGRPVRTLDDMRVAARAFVALGAAAAVIKGGHLDEDEDAVDVLFDGEGYYDFRARRVTTGNTHGTGCTFASAIAAELAKGADLPHAVDRAKRYLDGAIRAAASMHLGAGHGPVDHAWALRDTLEISDPEADIEPTAGAPPGRNGAPLAEPSA